MDTERTHRAGYLQVAQAPLATRPWLWKDVFTVLSNISAPSVSAVAAASALAKALRERHEPTPWDIFIYALHLTGVDPCQLCVCVHAWSLCWASWESQGEKWGLRGLIPLSPSWQVSSAQAREVPHKSTRCFPCTLPLSRAHAWIIWPPLLTCLLTYIWWKLGSLYSFLIISKRH